MDGEETTSKEIKRSAFELDSMTEQRFTPGASNDIATSSNNRYPRMNVAASMEDESSSPNESGGQQHRPSAIETILNDNKKPGA